MGNTNLARSQIAIETTVGMAVVPTRQLQGRIKMQNNPNRVLREEYRATMFGSGTFDDLSYQSSGAYTGRFVTIEAPFFFSMAIRGDVTPTTPAGTVRLWTYTQPSTLIALKSATAYSGDDTKALRAAGTFCNRLEISGSNDGAITVNHGLLGRELVADAIDASTFAFDTALTTPTNETAKNLLTQVFMNDTGAAIGTTAWAATAYEWTWTFDPKIEPDYTMDNTLDMTNIHRDAPVTTLQLTTKWNVNAVNEFLKYRALTKRFIRVESLGTTIETTYQHRLRLDGCYVATDFEPLSAESEGTQRGTVTYTAVDDATWAKKVEASVQTTLATLV